MTNKIKKVCFDYITVFVHIQYQRTEEHYPGSFFDPLDTIVESLLYVIDVEANRKAACPQMRLGCFSIGIYSRR